MKTFKFSAQNATKPKVTKMILTSEYQTQQIQILIVDFVVRK